MVCEFENFENSKTYFFAFIFFAEKKCENLKILHVKSVPLSMEVWNN